MEGCKKKIETDSVHFLLTKTMTTLIHLPHEVQDNISNYLRPHRWTGNYHFVEVGGRELVMMRTMEIDPFSKAPGVASIKTIHRNLNTVPLWKNREWKTTIRNWRDKNMTYMRWRYQHGTLPDEMIKKGWEKKINKDYRHQNCYVETILGKTVGTGFVEVTKEYKVIWFEVSLIDLITGVRPLPHCFGNDVNARRQAENGSFRISIDFVPAPSLETLIPGNKRLEWLKECFRECVLGHWGEKIAKKMQPLQKPNFMKDFKEMMDIPSDYKISYTDLFRMFLKELMVCSRPVHEKEGYFKRSENIDDICLRETN